MVFCCLVAISLAELEEQVYPVYRDGGVATGPGEKLEEKIEKGDGVQEQGGQGQEGQKGQEEEQVELNQDVQHELEQEKEEEEQEEQEQEQEEQEEWAEVLPTPQLLVGEFPHHFEPNSTLSDFSFEGQGMRKLKIYAF